MLNTMSAKNFIYAVLVVLISSVTGHAQSANLRDEQPQVPVEEIIRKFSEREREFRIARANYTYRQEVSVQELNGNDRVMGEYRVTSDITFDPTGKRTEKIVFAPANTLKNIGLTAQDLQDIREIQPFVLTSDDIYKYDLKYAGKEKIDEIDCYVFEVVPKKIEKDQRYFQGQIWVDDQDLQIVKTYGKAVPDIKEKGKENLFPRFETYREQIDAYWFPTYTKAVDTLQFSSGPQRMRQIIKYDKYKKFEADVKLTFGDAVDGAGVDQAPSTNRRAPALDPKLNEPRTQRKR